MLVPRARLVVSAVMLCFVAAEARGARSLRDVAPDEVALAFVDPTAWRCAGHEGCVDCTNVSGAAAMVRLLGGETTPGEMAVRSGATLHVCPR